VSGPVVAPNNGPTNSKIVAENQCEAQALSAMKSQPKISPGVQDVADAGAGALMGLLTDGASKVWNVTVGALTGLSASSILHGAQQGLMYQASINGCRSAAGISVGPPSF
jgi:hypothetical protein